jgi:hypothetical protein
MWIATEMCTSIFAGAGEPKVRLPGLPGSEEFLAAYQAALARSVPAKTIKERICAGSFA